MARQSIIRADSPLESMEPSDTDYDPKRRISNITATSISSFPESALPSDSEAVPSYNTKPRPTFRVGSLRRSPLPDRLSPSLRPPKHSPRRPRSRESDVAVQEPPAPLVLLHVTLLPPKLPWSRSVTEAVLPAEVKHRFGVLRAQCSGLVAQRGLLIAHPREEFEVLEESVLEALNLMPERIGQDGQYRPRTPNTMVDGDADEEGEEQEARLCESCGKCHDRDAGAGWYIRVYAANGLMRAGAWAAAWSEMERVDVEVLPCIPDAVRSRLDEVQASKDAGQEQEYAVQSIELPRIETTEPHRDPTASRQDNRITASPQQQPQITTPQQPKKQRDDLPQVYRPKDIPLSILLRNYIYLLLRDRRNLAILFLASTLLFSTWHGVLSPKNVRGAGISIFEGDLRVVGEVVPSQGFWPEKVRASAREWHDQTREEEVEVKAEDEELEELKGVEDPRIEVSIAVSQEQVQSPTAAPERMGYESGSTSTSEEPASSPIEPAPLPHQKVDDPNPSLDVEILDTDNLDTAQTSTNPDMIPQMPDTMPI